MVEKDGVAALIDPMSYQYLVGAEVDYKEGLEGSRFVVGNPNADAAPTNCEVDAVPTEDVELTVGARVRVSGTVVSHGGIPVANARLAMRLIDGPTSREETTTTGSDGSFSLAVDPGNATSDLTYELTVEPSMQNNPPLPRHRQIVPVSSDADSTPSGWSTSALPESRM